MKVDPNAGFNELPEEYFEGDNREAWRASRGVIQVRFLKLFFIYLESLKFHLVYSFCPV